MTVQNDIKLSLLSIHIDPSTTLLLSFVLAGYFYAVHVRSNPRPIAHYELNNQYQLNQQQYAQAQWQPLHTEDITDYEYEHDLGAAGALRRASFFRRISSGFRSSKHPRVLAAPAPQRQPVRLALPAPSRADEQRKNGRGKSVSQSPQRFSLSRALGFRGGGVREKTGEQRRVQPARVETHKAGKKQRLLE